MNKTKQIQSARFLIIIFYAVGVIGLSLSWTHDFFIRIFPVGILTSAILLGLFHTSYNRKSILVFAVVLILGLGIEMVGVKTGKIFGSYAYGDSVGIKLCDTPLLIGINWLMLTYLTVSITDRFKVPLWLRFLLPPLLMTGYDVVMEQVAGTLHMWSWTGNHIPLQNYVAWFLLGFLFTLFFRTTRVPVKNPLDITLFVSQVLFFLFLMLIT